MESNLNNIENNKPYERLLLKELTPEKEKKIIPPETIIKLFSQEFSNYNHVNPKFLSFYYYNCESIQDFGWGCAWRTTQTFLSFILSKNNITNKDITFKNLFLTYGGRNKLLEIYKKIYNNIPIYIQNTKFCPFESLDGWAEPFISQLISYDFGYKGNLFLINKYNKRAYAPEEEFKIIYTFDEFISKIIDYFKKDNCYPIILDDAQISICLAGVKTNEDGSYLLLILDPHVQQNEKGEKNIYYTRIEKDGGYIKKNNPQFNLLGHMIYFNKEKSWMGFIYED